MADPIGIAGSIVGMLAVTVQTAQFARDFLERAKEAPKEVKSLLDELGNLESVLKQFDSTKSFGQEFNESNAASESVLASLNTDMDQLKDQLGRIQKNSQQTNNSTGKSSFRHRVSRTKACAKWSWDEKTNRTCLETIGRLKADLTLALQM